MKSGSTLIEVMVSILILAIIAIAGAAYLLHANTTVAIQRNRMSALATASRYLEEMRGTAWATIVSRTPNSGTNYVRRTGLCSWSAGSASVITDNVTNNTVIMPVTTALCYVDADGVSPFNDCVQVTVSVGQPGRPGDSVVLQTLLGSY